MGKGRLWCGVSARTHVLLLSYFIVSVVYVLGINLYGPFLRTLVVCDTPASPGDPFSGSARCGDAKLVLAKAQAQEGRLVGAKLLVHGLAAPFLGALADRIGRKTVLLLSLQGFAVAFAFFTLISAWNWDSPTILLLCFAIEGVTNAFDVTYRAMLADLAPSLVDRSTYFAAYKWHVILSASLAQLVAVAILRLNLESYAVVWFVCLLVLIGDVCFVHYLVDETLVAPEKDTTLARQSACLKVAEIVKAPLQLATMDRMVRTMLLGNFIGTVVSAGIGSMMASFTIAAYGWRPGDLQMYTWACRPLEISALAASGVASRYVEPRRAAALHMVWGQLMGIIGIFKPFSPLVMLIPAYLGCFMAMFGPAHDSFNSSLFSSDKQAMMNSLQHMVQNVATSLSHLLWSSPLLFRPTATGWAATSPFLLSYLASLVALLVQLPVLWPYLAGSKGRGELEALNSKGQEAGSGGLASELTELHEV